MGVSLVALRFLLLQELCQYSGVSEQGLLVVLPIVNELLAEGLKQLMVVDELSDTPRDFLENLESPLYCLLVLPT